MKVLLKSLLFILLFILVIIFTIVTTKTGNRIAYLYIGDQISEKSRLDVKVLSLNFHQYPEFTGELLIEDAYRLNINGILSFSTLNLDFSISSNCISSNLCRIEDDVNIKGKIYGKFRDFTIKSEGKILDGTLRLDAIKKRRNFENVNLTLTDINSTKFFTALDEKPLLNGLSNIHLHLDTYGKKEKKGQLSFYVKDHNYSDTDIEVILDTKINIDNKKLTFDANLSMPTATVQLREGRYYQKLKYASAAYILDIQELADIEKITEVDAIGPFYATGDLVLDKKIKMKGLSESFGGMLNIAYEKKRFHFDLEDVPFNTIMQRLKQNPLLDAKMAGTIDYDVEQRAMHTEVKLKHVKFLQKELNELVQEKFGHDLNQEVFPNSSFEAAYKDEILTSYLKIANDNNYLIFKNTELNPTERSIKTTIDFQIQKHNISGKLYARNDGYTRNTLDTYLTFDGLVEKHYRLKLQGPLSKKWINMDYELSAARLPSHICTIEDDINISGHLYGPYTRLYIRGEGTGLDGKINFDTVKVYNELKDLNIKMRGIHANKLYTLLGLTDLPHGKATLDAHFKYLNNKTKQGTLSYTLDNASYKTLPLTLSSSFNIDNDLYTFNADINLNEIKSKISKGAYNAAQKSTHAFYTLDIKDLAHAQTLLGHKYFGSFYAMGEIDYKDAIEIKGLSKTFRGITEFLYKDEILYVDFKNASFKAILQLLDYPSYLEASTNGSVNYDFKKELLLVNTKLDDAKFLPSELVEKAYKKADINLLYETFDASELEIKYQNNIITGSIKLSNLESHIYLTDAYIDTKLKEINAYFDIYIQNKELTGKIYGSLNKPKINLNMQRLIQHEMDKQIDSMGGQAPREMMESMPMGGTAKDVVTGTAGSFMKVFF
ncbi:MAG: hypothetical protein U9O64_05470 [Campylobacterota bacterium]|nr:hypothetical protein [Campylobacterota bacterium]